MILRSLIASKKIIMSSPGLKWKLTQNNSQNKDQNLNTVVTEGLSQIKLIAK